MRLLIGLAFLTLSTLCFAFNEYPQLIFLEYNQLNSLNRLTFYCGNVEVRETDKGYIRVKEDRTQPDGTTVILGVEGQDLLSLSFQSPFSNTMNFAASQVVGYSVEVNPSSFLEAGGVIYDTVQITLRVNLESLCSNGKPGSWLYSFPILYK